MLVGLALCSLLAWIYLSLFHGDFWKGDQLLDPRLAQTASTDSWPPAVAVVPARNEAEGIERCLRSLLEQDYPSSFDIVLVDDHSDDGTGERALELASSHPNGARLHVIRAETMPAGWVGKMWAVETGVAHSMKTLPETRYLLLTDADVEHSPRNLRQLVAKAETERLDLVSLMVRLHCKSGWEKLLIPAFVYFFQQLYPFPRINDPKSSTAGAAGGCMLVRNDALQQAGGIASIRGEIIDDCALGAAIKANGKVWLGLSASEYSFRPYQGLSDIWNMVARSAYTQLKHSPALLAGCTVGLVLVYLVPPAVTVWGILAGDGLAAISAALAWGLMARSFLPTLKLYRLPPWRALLLPFAGLLYTAMTLDSGRRHARGLGAQWKGRIGASAE